MYGLAVWERERQDIVVGADRVGARTLYYTTEGATRWIAPHYEPWHPIAQKTWILAYEIILLEWH